MTGRKHGSMWQTSGRSEVRRHWQRHTQPHGATARSWGSCEPALEPDFQTLSITLATAVTVHRAGVFQSETVCTSVCVWRDKSQWLCINMFLCGGKCVSGVNYQWNVRDSIWIWKYMDSSIHLIKTCCWLPLTIRSIMSGMKSLHLNCCSADTWWALSPFVVALDCLMVQWQPESEGGLAGVIRHFSKKSEITNW